MNAGIIPTVPFLQNPVITAVHLTTPAADVPVVIQIRHTAIVTLVRADILLPALTDTAVHLIKDVPAVYKAVLNVINVTPLRRHRAAQESHLMSLTENAANVGQITTV